MPRNYSVKQTVEMLKSNIKKAKELDKSYAKEMEDVAEPTPPEPVVTQTETTSKDEIIKFGVVDQISAHLSKAIFRG